MCGFVRNWRICVLPFCAQISRNQEIPGSNPGQVSPKTCWPNGKAPDYGFYFAQKHIFLSFRTQHYNVKHPSTTALKLKYDEIITHTRLLSHTCNQNSTGTKTTTPNMSLCLSQTLFTVSILKLVVSGVLLQVYLKPYDGKQQLIHQQIMLKFPISDPFLDFQRWDFSAVLVSSTTPVETSGLFGLAKVKTHTVHTARVLNMYHGANELFDGNLNQFHINALSTLAANNEVFTYK